MRGRAWFVQMSIALLSHLIRIGGARLIDGIFTEPTLAPGYNLVASIPEGATALNVTELRHTRNYLAVRLRNGTFLLNGDYNINWSGEYEAAGTTFVYLRQTPRYLESFAAAGPLREPIDVMVLYQEPNPGIVYRYVLPAAGVAAVPQNPHSRLSAATGRTSEIDPPKSHTARVDAAGPMVGDEAPLPPRRFRRRRVTWKAAGLTECSKSCGGGVQSMRYACVREHTQTQVSEKRCHALEKPATVALRCNARPCPAKWRSGPWSECSVSCGSGVRSRQLECVQEVNSLLTVRVADGACLEPKTPQTTEACNASPCDAERSPAVQPRAPPRWTVGAWSQCSVSCGRGERTRTVTCNAAGPRHCDVEEQPPSREACDSGLCPARPLIANDVSTGLSRASPWLLTEWSDQCSAECGTGVQSRMAVCQHGESCDEATRPETTRVCSSDKTCGGQWFAGPWTQCSPTCGAGEQIRDAVCVTSLRGSLRVVLDMNCPVNKPETRRSCRGPPCASEWFTSDWTQCTRSCGKGLQKREVRCLRPDGRPPESDEQRCDDDDRPAVRRACNEHPCKDGHDSRSQAMQVQNDPEIANGLDDDPACKDSFSNCNLVTQARLCTYKFYQKSCCLSCFKAKQENE